MTHLSTRRILVFLAILAIGLTAWRYQSAQARRGLATQPVHWDPMGDHNAAVAAMDPQDRAFPLIAEATARLRAMPDETWSKKPGTMLPGFIDAKAGDPEWHRLVAWAKSEPVRTAMALVREAAAKPEIGAPLSVRDHPEWIAILAAHGVESSIDPLPAPAETLMINALLPHLPSIRDLAVICDAHARIAVEQQDTAALMDAIENILGLASHASDPSLILMQIVRIALLVIASDRIAETLMHHTELIDDAAAARFDTLLANALADGWTDLDPVSELIIFEDIIRRMVDNRGVFDPELVLLVIPALDEPGDHAPPPASTAPLAVFDPDLMASYDQFKRYAAAGRQATQIPFRPYPVTLQEMKAWSEQTDSIPGRAGRLLINIMNPAWANAARTLRTAHQNTLGLRVALAAHRHQLRHDQPPTSLDAIDPDLLQFDPVDGFTGARLIYRWSNNAHLVYALGADLDDDAGRHATNPDGEPIPFISDEYLTDKWDGDWLIFPSRE